MYPPSASGILHPAGLCAPTPAAFSPTPKPPGVGDRRGCPLCFLRMQGPGWGRAVKDPAIPALCPQPQLYLFTSGLWLWPQGPGIPQLGCILLKQHTPESLEALRLGKPGAAP